MQRLRRFSAVWCLFFEANRQLQLGRSSKYTPLHTRGSAVINCNECFLLKIWCYWKVLAIMKNVLIIWKIFKWVKRNPEDINAVFHSLMNCFTVLICRRCRIGKAGNRVCSKMPYWTIFPTPISPNVPFVRIRAIPLTALDFNNSAGLWPPAYMPHLYRFKILSGRQARRFEWCEWGYLLVHLIHLIHLNHLFHLTHLFDL